ncbi:MAG: DUF3575 domain-containing protein [Bacteroidales bacterium]|nr:DUF3575 domain-containing protein [Bacteroidales bacterium]
MCKNFRRVFLVFAVLVGVSVRAQANQDPTSDIIEERKDSSKTEQFILHYRVNETELDADYMNNKEQLHKIRHYFANSPRIDSVTIYSWASPEGGIKFNTYLSRERGKTAKRLLLSLSPDSTKFNSGKIKLSPTAENWAGLEKLVEERYFRHDRDKVLKILRTKGISDETRKWRLQQLNEGYSWKILIRRYMPELRAATWICVWAEIIDPMPEVAAIVAKAMAEERPIVQEQKAIALPVVTDMMQYEHPVLALRTNMLVPALNFGVEVPLGNSWSVSGDYYYPWVWPHPINKNCFELLGWSLEGRYWFGKNRNIENRLQGHSIGIYGAAGYYDFERNYAGQQGEFISTGLDYTYALPVGRKSRLHLEFTIAVGYIHSWARNYHVNEEFGPLFKDDGDILFDYFGPTKAAVSLVLPFMKKEGRK